MALHRHRHSKWLISAFITIGLASQAFAQSTVMARGWYAEWEFSETDSDPGMLWQLGYSLRLKDSWTASILGGAGTAEHETGSDVERIDAQASIIKNWGSLSLGAGWHYFSADFADSYDVRHHGPEFELKIAHALPDTSLFLGAGVSYLPVLFTDYAGESLRFTAYGIELGLHVLYNQFVFGGGYRLLDISDDAQGNRHATFSGFFVDFGISF